MADIVKQEIAFPLGVQPKRKDMSAIPPHNYIQRRYVLDQNAGADALVTALDCQFYDLPRSSSATGNCLVHDLIIDKKQVLVFEHQPFFRIPIELFSLALNKFFDFFKVKILVEVVPRLVGLTQVHHQCTEVHVRLSVLCEDMNVTWFENFAESIEVPNQRVGNGRALSSS